MNTYRPPHILLCGIDNIEREPDLPLWAQVAVAILRIQTYPGLAIDIVASVAPDRDVEAVKEVIMAAREPEYAEVHFANVVVAAGSGTLPSVQFRPEHTYACFCGVEPPAAVPDTVKAIYIATDSAPARPSFAFDRLGPKGVVVLRENEARDLLEEFVPVPQPDQLSGRELVRALVAQPRLQAINGIIVTYGESAINGCVASVNVNDIVYDDEDEDHENGEEKAVRYEFDVPKAIIGSGYNIVPSGAYAAFLGKLIVSFYMEDGFNENQFGFHLEQACVAAATTALARGKTLFDLPRRIRKERFRDNVVRYIYSQRLLRGGETARRVDQTKTPPPRPQISWRAPTHARP